MNHPRVFLSDLSGVTKAGFPLGEVHSGVMGGVVVEILCCLDSTFVFTPSSFSGVPEDVLDRRDRADKRAAACPALPVKASSSSAKTGPPLLLQSSSMDSVVAVDSIAACFNCLDDDSLFCFRSSAPSRHMRVSICFKKCC